MYSQGRSGGGNFTNSTNSTNSTQYTQGVKSASRRLMQQQPTNQSNVSTSTSTAKDEMIDDSMTCSFNAIDIFTSTYAEPIYGCPQNTYRKLFGCDICSSTATSPTASLSVGSCQACASSRHLTCDGLGCQDCPKGYISNVGSLLIGMKEREEERESVCAFVVCDGLCVSAMCVFACLSVCRVRSNVYLCINSCMDSLVYTNLDVFHKISTSPAHLLPCFYVFSNMLSDVFSNVPPVMHTLNPEP